MKSPRKTPLQHTVERGGGGLPSRPPTPFPTVLLQYNMLEILFSYCRKGSSFICQSVKRISQFNLLLLLSGFIQKSKTYRAGGTRGARLVRYSLNVKLFFHNACMYVLLLALPKSLSFRRACLDVL